MLAGVIAMEVMVAAETALALEVMAPDTAVMEVAVVLLAIRVANPVLVIPTVAGAPDTQVTEEVRLAVVPLL
jgi:hypothetical protein